MKKVLLSVLSVSMFIATANAQPFKQAGGEKNLQVLLAPLGGQPISINGISFRKFNATGTAAWRLNLFIGMTNKTDILFQAGDTMAFPKADNDMYGTHLITGLNPEADKRTSTFTFSLRPGYEKHFAGTERLSPYIGAEILFSHTSASVETDQIDNNNYTFPYDVPFNITDTVSAPWTIYTLTKNGDGASTTIGINLIAGFDYYIAKNVSLGAEIGFGFSSTTMPDIEDQYLKVAASPDPNSTSFTATTNVTVSHTVTDLAKRVQGKSSQLGPNVVGQIKLGWLF